MQPPCLPLTPNEARLASIAKHVPKDNLLWNGRRLLFGPKPWPALSRSLAVSRRNGRVQWNRVWMEVGESAVTRMMFGSVVRESAVPGACLPRVARGANSLLRQLAPPDIDSSAIFLPQVSPRQSLAVDCFLPRACRRADNLSSFRCSSSCISCPNSQVEH